MEKDTKMHKLKMYDPENLEVVDIDTNLPRDIVEEVGLALYNLPGYATSEVVMWNREDEALYYVIMDDNKKSERFKVTVQRINKSW